MLIIYLFIFIDIFNILFIILAQNLAGGLDEVFERWQLSRERVHCVVRDNGANIVAAFRDSVLPDASCFAHTLQLCINSAVFDSRMVSVLINAARQLVGHFKHSALQTERIRDIQKELGLPNHFFIQDVRTRWNSAYYMLERLFEQKRAIS